MSKTRKEIINTTKEVVSFVKKKDKKTLEILKKIVNLAKKLK